MTRFLRALVCVVLASGVLAHPQQGYGGDQSYQYSASQQQQQQQSSSSSSQSSYQGGGGGGQFQQGGGQFQGGQGGQNGGDQAGSGGLAELAVHQLDSNGQPISRFLNPQLYQANAQDVQQQVAQVSEMKQDFSQRWGKQNQDWTKEQELESTLQQKIQQKDPGSLQKYQQEQSTFQQQEQQYVQQKQQIQGKIENIQATLGELKQKNEQILIQTEQNPTAVDKEQAKNLLTEYRQKQQAIAAELPAALNEAAEVEKGHAGMRQQVNQWREGYQNNPILAGGGGDNNWDQWLDADYWEKHHEEMWGQFEQFFGKWQNWANDPNAGNYKLANRRWGAFDNGEFNIEKGSEEFFGPDHVANDDLFGNYTNNSGFGSGGAGGDGGYGSGGAGGAAGGAGGAGQFGSGSGAGGDANAASLLEAWRRYLGSEFTWKCTLVRVTDRNDPSKNLSYEGQDQQQQQQQQQYPPQDQQQQQYPDQQQQQ